MVEDKFVQLEDLRLHYRDLGGEGKPVALFLHGLTGNAHCFDHVAAEFVGSHHPLALDFRGHGDSDWPSGGDYAFHRHVGDTLAFLEALEVTKVSLIGNSLGGVVAMVIAATKSGLVERLVLNDIGPEINVAAPKGGKTPPNHIEQEFRDIAEALECYRRSYPPVQTLPGCGRHAACAQFHASRRKWTPSMENGSSGSGNRPFCRAVVLLAGVVATVRRGEGSDPCSSGRRERSSAARHGRKNVFTPSRDQSR